MGTKPFRLFLFIIIGLFCSIYADYSHHHLNANRQRITLSGLFTHSHYPSIHFALEQVNSELLSSRTNLEFALNKTEGIIHVRSFKLIQKFLFFYKFFFQCDVGTGVKTFFDMLNQSSLLRVLFTDACQNVLSYISDSATYFRLPVVCIGMNENIKLIIVFI